MHCRLQHQKRLDNQVWQPPTTSQFGECLKWGWNREKTQFRWPAAFSTGGVLSSSFSIRFFPGRSISKAWNEDQSPSNHIWGGDTLRPIFVMFHDGDNLWWGKYMQLLYDNWINLEVPRLNTFAQLLWNPWVICSQGPKLWDLLCAPPIMLARVQKCSRQNGPK